MEKLKKSVNIDDMFEKAFSDEAVPKLYFNGFVAKVSAGDIQFVLELNNKPVAYLNASFSIAKTFARHLGSLIQSLEENTGNTIMTHEDIINSFKSRQNPDPHKLTSEK